MGDTTDVDVVVIGLGPGGKNAARRLAEAGLRVVAVEKNLVGGECPFYGCTPSKLMIRASDVLAEARRVDTFAGHADVRPDWAPVARRIREITADWSDESHVEDLRSAGADVVHGTGRLAGPGRVVVESHSGSTVYVAARGVVLGTGTDPAELPIPGLSGTPYWTNREVVRLTELPSSLLVVGGGAVGAELTQVFQRFGVAVTLVEASDRLLGPEEPEAADIVLRALRRDGVDVRAGVDISAVSHDPDGFRLTLGDEGTGESVGAERLLVAAGRSPNLSGLGLDTVGLDDGADRIRTDERMRAAERLWAIGDITGKGAYTHVATYQAAVAVRDLLGENGPWADYRAVSRVTFTEPEVGAVGLTEQQARDAGLRVRTGTADVGSSSRGWIHETDGVVKVVADADRGILVGATVVSPFGGEVVGLLSTAVHAEVPVATLRGMHFAFPTLHSAIETALADLDL
ncbi:MAG: merA 2 [Nocardioides sp.]|jgi:pyruvate/2-oxoglutarate dehydrogenase complex dihydrolipoamide dehydrogenase (E3) component|nr:merA 2 [Nocardioides sp.]